MIAVAKKKTVAVQDVEFGDVEIEDLRAKISAEDSEIEMAAEESAEAEELELPDLDADMGTDIHYAVPGLEMVTEPLPCRGFVPVA